MTDLGHNGVNADHLKALIERIERLEADKAQIGEDIKDVYQEAKSAGYDSRIMKKVIAIRKRDPAERSEEEVLLDLYCQAVGVQLSLSFDSAGPL